MWIWALKIVLFFVFRWRLNFSFYDVWIAFDFQPHSIWFCAVLQSGYASFVRSWLTIWVNLFLRNPSSVDAYTNVFQECLRSIEIKNINACWTIVMITNEYESKIMTNFSDLRIVRVSLGVVARGAPHAVDVGINRVGAIHLQDPVHGREINTTGGNVCAWL